MSTTRSILPYNYTSLRAKMACQKFQASALNPSCVFRISKHKKGFLSIGQGVQSGIINPKINMVVNSSVQPGVPLPSSPPSNSGKPWILGLLLTVILPFLRHKWGPLLQLKNEVETVVETAEQITEDVEKVSEEVERVAEEVADQLPEGGKLKDAVTFVENVAKETDKDAHLAEGLVDKVEEVEKGVEDVGKDVESLIEPIIDEKTKEIAKEANGKS